MKNVILETAKLLKEAGFRQSTILYYNDQGLGRHHIGGYRNDMSVCAAPTTDELLEELPPYLHNLWLTIRKLYKTYSVSYMFDEGYLYEIEYESLPEALAQMWLYLKKEGLI